VAEHEKANQPKANAGDPPPTTGAAHGPGAKKPADQAQTDAAGPGSEPQPGRRTENRAGQKRRGPASAIGRRETGGSESPGSHDPAGRQDAHRGANRGAGQPWLASRGTGLAQALPEHEAVARLQRGRQNGESRRNAGASAKPAPDRSDSAGGGIASLNKTLARGAGAPRGHTKPPWTTRTEYKRKNKSCR
jgi:hypothetical protein